MAMVNTVNGLGTWGLRLSIEAKPPFWSPLQNALTDIG
jgi:hypothetical protein